MYKFVKEIVAPIADKLCSTKPLKYSEIIEWDRRIREFSPIYDYEQEHDLYPFVTNAVTFLFTLYKEISTCQQFFTASLVDIPQ